MLNRKLLEVLVRLPEAQQKRLRLFLLSPYHTQDEASQKIVQLYDYILQYGADEQNPNLDKGRVAQVFYPEKPYRPNEKGPVDSISSRLFLLTRRFLHWQKLERMMIEPDELLTMAEFYRNHAMEDRFVQTIEHIRKAEANYSVRDATWYWRQYEIATEIANFQSVFSGFLNEAFEKNLHFNLDAHYVQLKFEMLCLNAYGQMTTGVRPIAESPLTIAVMALDNTGPIMEAPVNQAYRLIYDLFSDVENTEKFEQLEALLSTHQAKFSSQKYYSLQAHYRQFWLMRYRKQGLDFTQKIFELYVEHLEKGYLYLDNCLMISAMRVIVQFGLRNKAFDWVRRFLDEHPPARLIGTQYVEDVYQLHYAEYHFAKQEYEAAEAKLKFVPVENQNIGLLAEILLIRIYYETQNDLLEFRMKAVAQRIRRAGIGPARKERFLNFLKKLDKIVKYGWERSNPKRQKLIQEIQETDQIIEREWLLEKLKSGR